MISAADLPATEQAALLRSGALSATELVRDHLDRIAALNDSVNAIVTVLPERALAAAAEADRLRAGGAAPPPLHGLPIAHKDLVDTAGVRTTYGSPSFRDHVPDADELLVTRLRAAGAIMVGKTNTPEWGAGSHTFNPVFGATRNPWDTSRTAGGSSGGAAVALACRMLPLADGSDLGGSLRNPAAWNGVVGLRPTPGVVPSWPSDSPWLPFSVDGPMARTAADVALLLAAMAGPDPRAPLSQRAAALDLATPLDADLRGRRVAWSPALNGLPVDPAILDVLEPAVAGLAGLGLDVTADEPDLAGADTVFETWRAFGFALSLGELYDRDGDRMKETVRWNVERGRALTVADLTTATRLHAGLNDRAIAFFDRYDYLACPVTQVEPFPVEVEYPAEVAGVRMGSYLEWMRVCSRISVTGCPAISIPAGLSAGGLPVGLQLVARPFAERSLLEVAHAVDAQTGYSRRLPPAGVAER
ncbi:MAG TPA: amidase [Gaiellales bacterium]|nr:amidase [Gaiellales bacterium]